jgi:hypothetical protein
MGEQMKLVWWANPIAVWLCIIAGIAIGCGVGGGLIVLFWQNNPPIQVLTSYFVRPVIEEGDDIQLYVKVTNFKNRRCPGGVTREFIRETTLPDGKKLPEIFRQEAPAPIFDAIRTEYIITFPSSVTGLTLPPDKYSFRGETAYYCGWFAKSTYLSELNGAGDLTIVPKGTLPK